MRTDIVNYRVVKPICACIACVSIMACSNDTIDRPEELVEVKFGSELIAMEQTRVTNGNTWSVGDQVTIGMKTASSTPFITYKAQTAEKSTTFVPVDENSKHVFPQDGAVDFLAFYPATLSGMTIGSTTATIPAHANPDILFATATNKSKSDPTVTLPFKHILSQLVIILKPGDGVTENELKTATLTFKGLAHTGDFNMINGTFRQDNLVAKDYTVTVNDEVTTTGFAISMIPQGPTAGATMTIQTSSGNYTWKEIAAVILQPNRIHTHTFTLDKNSIANVTGTISDWEEGSGGSQTIIRD